MVTIKRVIIAVVIMAVVVVMALRGCPRARVHLTGTPVFDIKPSSVTCSPEYIIGGEKEFKRGVFRMEANNLWMELNVPI